MNKSTPKRRCPLCRGGYQQPGETTFTADVNSHVVVIRNVPAMICDQCGARSIDNDIAAKLEKMVEAARKKRSPVQVLSAAHLAA